MKAKNVRDSWPINEPDADMNAFLENVSFLNHSDNTCVYNILSTHVRLLYLDF